MVSVCHPCDAFLQHLWSYLSFSFSILSFCLFILFMGFSRQEYRSGLPFPSPWDHILSELSTMTHPSWVALHGMARSFTELDKAVVHVIRVVSFLWLWFVCLPSDALSQHLPSYLGFSHLGRGVSLHSCSSKVQPLLLTLDEGYLLTAAPPDLERGVAPLGPPVPALPLLLGCGVAPLGCCPWPWARGNSSWPRFCVVHRSQHASASICLRET